MHGFLDQCKGIMTSQKILLGDCLDVLANERNVPAIVADPPANIAFMGRLWDRAHPCNDYVLPCTPRSKAHERELRSEESFIRYWSQRYAMAYDIADQHATAIIWTLPRTSYQTATAMRRAGWDIRDNLVHLFGTGWAKSGNALAPGQEGWILATKGKPDLDIDACRVPRGGGIYGSGAGAGSGNIANQTGNGRTRGGGVGIVAESHPLGSLPKNALLSHCEECVRVGVKRVKGGASINHNRDPLAYIETAAHGKIRKVTHDMTYTDDGSTESVPAWHCLAGCVCGARSKWDPEKPLPRCPCGETWRWLCAVAEVNAQSGNRPGMSGGGKHREGYQGGMFGGIDCESTLYADQGGSSRFFNTFSYLSKCSSSERHAGCENLYWKANKKNPFGFDQVTREEWEAILAHPLEGKSGRRNDAQIAREHAQGQRAHGNVHPTVKSYRLMHWWHSLTNAKKIVDLCAGSGTGMIAAALDDIEWIGAEMCQEAVTIAQARHAFWSGLSPEAIELMKKDSATKAIQKQNKIARLENK